MAKKRKTREQKILADLRHNFRHNLISEAPAAGKVKLQLVPITTEQKPQTAIALNSYPYLVQDLVKTGVLTLFIFAFQIILFTLLKNHILTIPGIGY
jgi:hypothetical protein